MVAPLRPEIHIPPNIVDANKIFFGIAALSIASIFLGLFGKNSWGATGLKTALYGGLSVGVVDILAALYKRFAMDNKPWVAVENRDGWQWKRIPSSNSIWFALKLIRPNEFFVYWDGENRRVQYLYKEPNEGGEFEGSWSNGGVPFGYRQTSPLPYHLSEDGNIRHKSILIGLQNGEWTSGKFVDYDDTSHNPEKFVKVSKKKDRLTFEDGDSDSSDAQYVALPTLEERLKKMPIALEAHEADSLRIYLQVGEAFEYIMVTKSNSNSLIPRCVGSPLADAPKVSYKELFDRQQEL